MRGKFVTDTQGVIDEKKSWFWLKQGDLKRGIEALVTATQKQEIGTNYINRNIDKTRDSPMCRVCAKRGETISNIIFECSSLAQKEYKRRHDNVARQVHWEICKKYNLPRTEKWYNHKPDGVITHEDIKLLWDLNINSDYEIGHKRPGIVVELKSDKECLIIDIAVAGDNRIKQKEEEK